MRRPTPMRKFRKLGSPTPEEPSVLGVQVEEFDSDPFAAKLLIEVRVPKSDKSVLGYELAAIDALRIGTFLVEVAKKHLLHTRLERDKRVLKMDESKRTLILWLVQNSWFTDDEGERAGLMEQIIRFHYSPDGPEHDSKIKIPEHTRLGQVLLEGDPALDPHLELALEFLEVDERL